MLHRNRADAIAGPEGVLASVRFGLVGGAPGVAAGTLGIDVPLRSLDAAPAPVDVFAAHGPVASGRHGDVAFATDGETLVGSVRLDERAAGGLHAATRRAYEQIFALLDTRPCRVPLRFWNYVPRINADLDGLERYRVFNAARQDAFLAAGRAAFEGAPAACALGSQADALVVHVVAGRDAPLAIENPRQVSAYRYPADYGPRAPTFSRAVLARTATPVLFISGTASIVGHRSLHAGDAGAQTAETFVNLRAVVDAANAANVAKSADATRFAARFALDTCAFTVYVRRGADLAAIRARFVHEVGAASRAARDAVFLEADICRAELLVEIEATAHAA